MLAKSIGVLKTNIAKDEPGRALFKIETSSLLAMLLFNCIIENIYLRPCLFVLAGSLSNRSPRKA